MAGGVAKVDTPPDFNTILTQCYEFSSFDFLKTKKRVLFLGKCLWIREKWLSLQRYYMLNLNPIRMKKEKRKCLKSRVITLFY